MQYFILVILQFFKSANQKRIFKSSDSLKVLLQFLLIELIFIFTLGFLNIFFSVTFDYMLFV